jgi:hypothetical protein
MEDGDIKGHLAFLLQQEKIQIEYLYKLHGWVISINETLQELYPDYAKLVEQHSLYQVPPSSQKTLDGYLQSIQARIDALKG